MFFLEEIAYKLILVGPRLLFCKARGEAGSKVYNTFKLSMDIENIMNTIKDGMDVLDHARTKMYTFRTNFDMRWA